MEKRQSMREKQNYLLDLAKSQKMCLDLRLSADYPGCPTLRELHHYIFPEWEEAINQAIQVLEKGR